MTTRIALAIAFLCLIGFTAGLLYARSIAVEDHGFLEWRDASVVTMGNALYRTNCAGCHGIPDGTIAPAVPASAQPATPHDASGHTWQHPDFALFQLVRDGVAVANCTPVDPELMPKFKGIVTDRELVAILSYIKSTWPEATRSEHDAVNRMYGPYNRAVSELIGG